VWVVHNQEIRALFLELVLMHQLLVRHPIQVLCLCQFQFQVLCLCQFQFQVLCLCLVLCLCQVFRVVQQVQVLVSHPVALRPVVWLYLWVQVAL
jgi:hypothetical protein